MSNITSNSRFVYTAFGNKKDGTEVRFGGEAKTLGDAIGGVFGHDDVDITEWNAVQNVQYWEISIKGVKGGKPASEIRYTFDAPSKSSATVAGLTIGFDTVHSVKVTSVCADRDIVDALVEKGKGSWI